jgi:hypothetical protein
MVRQSVKRSTTSMGASNSHETANNKTTCTRPSKQVIKPASGTKRTINLDDALAISFAPKPKRRKTTDAEILARYQELDDEEAADSEVDRNAQLCVLRDISSYMHGHSTDDKKLLDGYSMLQYLLYTQFFAENQYLPQAPIQARKSNTVRLLTDVLSAYGEAAKKYMNDKDRGVESRDALQELHTRCAGACACLRLANGSLSTLIS